MSRLGLSLCALYAAIVGASAALAVTGDGDPKGQLVVLQFPIALQSATLDALGLGWLVERLSWKVAYLVLGVPTLALLYVAGRFLGSRLR